MSHADSSWESTKYFFFSVTNISFLTIQPCRSSFSCPIIDATGLLWIESRGCRPSKPIPLRSTAFLDTDIMTSTSGIAASCPLNATFYACDFGERFLGCCADGSPTNICNHGCPQENLLPATFEKRYYDYVARAACTSGDWWSCANISPLFLGCCLTNPCLAGCPPSDLTAAIFPQNQTDNALYSAIPNAAAASFLTTSSSITTVASSTPAVPSGATHSATSSPSPIHENSTGKIVGGVVGGVIAVAGILFGLLLLYRHLWSSKDILSDSSGANEKGSIKGTSTRQPDSCGYFRN